jgi:hypothetical protein
MAPEEAVRPVTVYDAAVILGRAPSTIHLWAIRYGTPKLGKVGRKVYYDLNDLAVIERETTHGHPVPATPEERAAIRAICPLWAAERQAAQQAAA